MDRISNMSICEYPATPIKSIKGYERGIDFKQIATEMPYMYADTPERVVFIADKKIIDQVVDWFGQDIRMSIVPDNENIIKVEIHSSLKAMEHWALQYINYVEVIKPENIRERIRTALNNGIGKYNI
jgi:predicted DNA-binding transcriptional regulator YafY